VEGSKLGAHEIGLKARTTRPRGHARSWSRQEKLLAISAPVSVSLASRARATASSILLRADEVIDDARLSCPQRSIGDPKFELWARLRRTTVVLGAGPKREQPMTSTPSTPSTSRPRGAMRRPSKCLAAASTKTPGPVRIPRRLCGRRRVAPTRCESLQDRFRADLRRLAELFEEKPNATDSTKKITISRIEPLSDTNIHPEVLKLNRPSLRRRAAWSLIIFCMGVAATLAWQSFYGQEATRDMIASSYPQRGWLEPQTVGAGTAPATTSDFSGTPRGTCLRLFWPDREWPRFWSISRVCGKAWTSWLLGVVANQQQMASDTAKLKSTEQGLDTISSAPPQPADTSASNPLPVSPPSVNPAASDGRRRRGG
jgi:hypothetical protein